MKIIEIVSILIIGTSIHAFNNVKRNSFLQRNIFLQATESDLTGKVIAQRYLYKLSEIESSTTSPFSIEERRLYVVNQNGTLDSINKKSFLLREDYKNSTHSTLLPSQMKKNGQKRSFIHIGPVLHTIQQIQEGDSSSEHPGGGKVGLGESIWDSSFVMALYCAAYPELYRGQVLELGSGVGIAGILSYIAMATSKALLKGQPHDRTSDSSFEFVSTTIEKLTLTDINEPSLTMCRDNVLASSIPSSKVEVKSLDWNSRISPSWHGKFNFIIASDCAYYYPLIHPLARTLAYSLAPSPYDTLNNKQDIEGSFLHIGPEYRDAVKDLRNKLTRGYKMNARVESKIVLERYDLVPLVLDTVEKEEEQLLEETNRGFVEYQSLDTSVYTALLAHHNEDYDGYNGDYFFPAETGSES